jgi:hypothetical protein
MTLPLVLTPTPLRALSDALFRSKRGCKRPFITNIGPDCVARSAWGRCLRNARVCATAALSPDMQKTPFGFKANAAPVGTPWMWTLAFGHHEDRASTHGYAATREDTMAAFAKSWRRDGA